MNRLTTLCATAALVVLVPGCGSPPKENFYTLSDSVKAEAGSVPAQDYGVIVGPVYVPDVVDRPQFVLRMPGSQVRIADQVRWAEPLKEGIGRIVAINLAQSLNNGRVSPRSPGGVGEADYRVIIDVQRFDSALGEAAIVEVMWTVRRTRDGEQQTMRVRAQEAVTGAGYEELVAAHARALATVTRTIADAIRTSRQKDVASAAAAPPQ